MALLPVGKEVDDKLSSSWNLTQFVSQNCRGAKRGAWRHRFEGSEKRSCSREPDRPSSVSSSSSETDIRVSAKSSPPILAQSTAAGSLLTMADPSISYKDVLLQFAQLTQSEKQPGSPQVRSPFQTKRSGPSVGFVGV